MKRFLPLFLCCALLLPLLAGCGSGDQALNVMWEPNPSPSIAEEVTKPAETTVPQSTMPQEELDWAVDYLEYTGIAAIYHLNEVTQPFSSGYQTYSKAPLYIGDLDGDNQPEIIFGMVMGMMDRGNGREYVHAFSQSGFTYYVDKDGNFYCEESIGDGSHSDDWDDPGMPNPGWDAPLPESGNSAWWGCWYGYYTTFYPGNRLGFRYSSEALHEVIDPTTYTEAEEPYWQEIIITTQDGATYENQAAEEYLENLELQEITTYAADYLSTAYDAAYASALLEALDRRFAADYPGYRGTQQADVDGDGELETLFVIADYLAPWRSDVHLPQRDYPVEMNTVALDVRADRTVLLIADQQSDQICFQALAAAGIHNLGQAQANGDFLQVGSGLYLRNVNNTSGVTIQDCQYLSRYLAQFGYTNSYFMLADLCDDPGQEVISYCYKDGTWYLVVMILRAGRAEILSLASASDRAYYLVQIDGKTWILDYYQGISQWTGSPYYSYNIYRYSNGEYLDYYESRTHSIAADGSNAYETSLFQQALQKFLVKVIVIYDPFAMTGSRYPTESQVAFGEIAQEQNNGTVGYVQLNDPSTWLHLREGPGTRYDRVLIDPSDPDSFIRQAHGSAVTILETIETGDPENPVWVKIRIQYAGLEIIGYSSKTYIRIPGE